MQFLLRSVKPCRCAGVSKFHPCGTEQCLGREARLRAGLRAGGSRQLFLHTLSRALGLAASVEKLRWFLAQHFLSASCSGSRQVLRQLAPIQILVGSDSDSPQLHFQSQLSTRCFPERCWGSGTWLWGSHLDKLLRPGILSLQSTDSTLDQPEAFSVGELPNILLVFAFCAVFCALGLPLFILEAAADKFSLSEFSQDALCSCS